MEPVESSTEWLFLQDTSEPAIDLSLPPSEPQEPEHPSFLADSFNHDLALEIPSLPDTEQISGHEPEAETEMASGAEVEETDAVSSAPEFEETLDDLAIEMREVFAEEMQEEVPALLEAAEAWSNQGGRDHLVTLRRGFHTIKGSSRMVGMTAIGDWGWSYEHLLNQVLDDRVASSPALRADVLSAVSLMNEALPVLSKGQQPPVSYWQESLCRAEAWSNGQPEGESTTEADVTESALEAETSLTEADMLTVETNELVEEAPSIAEEKILEEISPSEEMLHAEAEAEAEAEHVEVSPTAAVIDAEHLGWSPSGVDEVAATAEPESEPEEGPSRKQCLNHCRLLKIRYCEKSSIRSPRVISSSCDCRSITL
jgi:Chemotaxis protein histidine kinase and related kinases